jgi:hypothetical protein
MIHVRSLSYSVLVLLVAGAFVTTPGVLCQNSPRSGPQNASSIGPDTDLHRAARLGDLELLQRQLKAGANPNARNEEGRTPLIEAAAGGKLDAIRLLLSGGAGINLTSVTGRTPLIEATVQGHVAAAQLLIQSGADLDVRERIGTALEIAERTGRNDIAELLRQSGAHTFGRSVGDRVCVRPWRGSGYCGKVEAIDKTAYTIRVSQIVGCERGCRAKPDCSAGRRVGGADGIAAGDSITTVSWCLTDTGVQP